MNHSEFTTALVVHELGRIIDIAADLDNDDLERALKYEDEEWKRELIHKLFKALDEKLA